MKKPQIPPNFINLFKDMSFDEHFLALEQGSTIQGKYLHWDNLRRRKPPKGLNHEQWWVGLKLARSQLLKKLPFNDKNGKPFMFGMPESVLRSLFRIDRNATGQIGIDSQVTTKENRDRYLVSSFIEEAIRSSQMEGASTTHQEAKIMLRQGRNPRNRGEQMILNNYRAMQFIREIREEALTSELILELHRIVTEHTLDVPEQAGQLRLNNRVRVVDVHDGEILHQPPDSTQLPERLEQICLFANSTEDDSLFVPPVIRAIILHFMIGYDHPFTDGNGRTARALFYWSMARQGYWLMEYISISRLLHKAPAQYAKAYLYSETDDNDTTYFILHQLLIIERAIKALHKYLTRKANEQISAEEILRKSTVLKNTLNYRQITLLSHALRHAGFDYTVDSHKNSHGITYETARTDLLKLAGNNLLDKSKRGRAFIYTAPHDLHERIEYLQLK